MKILNCIIGIFILYYIINYIFSMIDKYKSYTNIIHDVKSETLYKLNELSFFKKVTAIIKETDLNFKIKNKNMVSALTLFFISVIFFAITFVITFKFLNLFIPSLILSSFAFFLPYYIIKYFSYCRKVKILNTFPNYVVSLKNYTDVNNDIIEAFRRANVEEPLSSYINKFNISIQKGIKAYDAFETLKTNINIKRINQFITLLQFCYIYGGNFEELLDKFSKIQMKSNILKEKEKQKIFSSKLVLLLLISINIYILFGFILTNNEYYNILVKTFMGNVILNVNILSYIFIFYMYAKLNKMED